MEITKELNLIELELKDLEKNGFGQTEICFEKIITKINKLKEAISVTRCCESDSEQLCDEGNLGEIKKLYTKVGNEWVEYKTE